MKKLLSILVASLALITTTAKANFVSGQQTTPFRFIKNNLTIQPNAATKDIKIIFTAATATEGVIAVIDESGKKVLQQNAKITTGNNSINIDNFHSLHEGNYTIQLTSNNEVRSTRFTVWK